MRDVLSIETERLTLRRPAATDAARIACFLTDVQVSRMTAVIPHPYPRTAADGWLMLERARRPLGVDHMFAIDLDREGLIGVIGAHKRGEATEVGYWIGRPFWGEGFASEALEGFVAEAETLGALEAGHFVDNPASGRVLEKAGFAYTGELRKTFSLARGAKVESRRMQRCAKRQAQASQMEVCL